MMNSHCNVFTKSAHVGEDGCSYTTVLETTALHALHHDAPLPATSADIPLSQGGIIRVLSYTPHEGEGGVPISVRIHFHSESSAPIYIRLVVGNKAVATSVRELEDAEEGRWQLDAAAPALDSLCKKVPLTVQALNADESILDSLTFGEFQYWVPDCPSPSQGVLKVDVNQDSAGDAPLLRRRRAATHLPTPSPFVSDRAPSSQARQRKRQSLRCIKDQSIIRAKYRVTGEVLDNLYPHTPILEIVTPLGVICANWDEMERQIGRRLVRFRKIQDGRRIILSCEVIKQEDYRETNIVISCIYREESEKSFVTSVDIIYLLERLTDDEFPVEEKNRIRRNLEGLRPTTVSKHKGGSEAFFLRIMEFPDPKPRNIEKDLKVFEWTQLGHALEKILSKYSIYTSSPSASTVSLPNESSPSSPQAVNTELLQLQNSIKAESDHTFVDPALMDKYEAHLAESMLFIAPDKHGYPNSPTASSFERSLLSLSIPYYGSDMSGGAHESSESSSGSWASSERQGEHQGMANVIFPSTAAAFDGTVMPMDGYEDVGAHHFYDPLGFRTIRDETLVGIPDHFFV